jgi:hypothetical protein
VHERDVEVPHLADGADRDLARRLIGKDLELGTLGRRPKVVDVDGRLRRGAAGEAAR